MRNSGCLVYDPCVYTHTEANTLIYSEKNLEDYRSKLLGAIFAVLSSPQLTRTCQYFTWISPGLTHRYACKSELSTNKFYACSKLWVSCGYLHANVIVKHQHGGHKGHNLLIDNPLKERSLAVNVRPSRNSACHCCHITNVFLARKFFILPTCVCMVISVYMGYGVCEDDEGKLLPSCW